MIIGIREQLGEIPISIDTTKSAVAQAAVEAGATWVNDISGGVQDPAMLEVVAKLGVPICLMHMRGEPATMQQAVQYTDVVAEVRSMLAARADLEGDLVEALIVWAIGKARPSLSAGDRSRRGCRR